MSRVVAIVQARMGSERLPGKVLMPVMGRPLLWYLLNQLKQAKRLEGIVIATSNQVRDDAIEEFGAGAGVHVVRGSERDVLDRFHCAAAEAKADYIVRITADCPLICPTVVDGTIENHFASGCDYTMNDVPGCFPRGYDAEVFSRVVLERTHVKARRLADREHVTYYIYTHTEEFSVNTYRDASFPRFPTDRICVDTQEDFVVVKSIIENVYREKQCMHYGKVLDFLQKNPSVAALNADVKQKTLTARELET
jgi:spore coat polysaccharide biosynthesis protein SpsF